jgi:hypothetical protein
MYEECEIYQIFQICRVNAQILEGAGLVPALGGFDETSLEEPV